LDLRLIGIYIYLLFQHYNVILVKNNNYFENYVDKQKTILYNHN